MLHLRMLILDQLGRSLSDRELEDMASLVGYPATCGLPTKTCRITVGESSTTWGFFIEDLKETF